MSLANNKDLKEIVKGALREDIGRRDITTQVLIPAKKTAKAVILSNQDCVVCGLGITSLVFKTLDKKIFFKPRAKDGDLARKNNVIADISGRARSILTAERTALNFLSLLSGIATKTKEYVNAVKPHKVKIMDTRKTIPALRILEKYAVRIGGGYNHRMSLDEMVLVKDNHIKVAKGYIRLPKATKGYQVEIEVKNLREFTQALKLKPDVIMLDNMSIKDIRKAVQIRNNLRLAAGGWRLKLEASGGVSLKNVKKIASTDVDFISIGALTHSVDSVDISLDVL